MTIKNALFKRPITRLITLPRRRWYRSSSRSTRSGVINDDDDDSVGNNYYHPSAYATLRVHGPDAKGIVVSVSQVLDRYGAAITQSEHWTDVREGLFFQRVEFCPLTPAFGEDQKRGIQRDLSAGIGPRLRHCINWRERVPRVAVFVSRSSHCLWELLLRHEAGELECDVVAVISNHDTLRSVAEDTFGIPFYVFPITAATKESQEAEQLRLLQDELQVDLIVLARYMQVLSSYFLDRFPYDRILNIHHSFLPAFTGESLAIIPTRLIRISVVALFFLIFTSSSLSFSLFLLLCQTRRLSLSASL